VGNPPDEAELARLLERAGAGDPGAVGELLARHREAVRRYVERRMDPRLRARVDPSDVVQEAQLEAARRLDDYLRRRPMPFHLWLCHTAHQQMLRLRRQHVEAGCRAVGQEQVLPDQSSVLLARHLLAAGATPSRQIAEAEMALRVHAALAQLDETDREVLLLRTFEGLSNLEVAQVLDLEPAAASKRYGRALVRLKAALTDAGGGES
jgi:RNA polymerase sigma-70 factor (ECF subfamily)